MTANLGSANSPTQEVRAIDFAQELHRVRAEEHGPTGRITRPLVNLPGLRVVLVSMRGGSRWNEHSTPGRITVQPLAGHIRMHYSDGQFELGPGKLAALAAAIPHAVTAVADSIFLLTIARPSE
jgi:quercetin dioxygenase-like cupin family protein